MERMEKMSREARRGEERREVVRNGAERIE
jgi:hypothetical protein